METSRTPSQSEIQQSLTSSAVIEKADEQRPGWDDLVSEGVIDRLPEPGADGEPEMRVNGHDNVVRLLQMQEQANQIEGDYSLERQSGIRRIPMRDRTGRIRLVAEQNEDRSGRKHGAVRIASIRYGKARRVSRFPVLAERVPWPWEAA